MRHDPNNCWECQEFLPHVRNPKPVNWRKSPPDDACEECHGTKLTTVRGICGGVEMDCDDQPCPYCSPLQGGDKP